MNVSIHEVLTSKDLKKFIWFGINLYINDKYAIPKLFIDDKTNLSKKKNPAFEFCDTKIFLAYKDGKIVGRIMGIINPVANEIWQSKYARFGWIEFINDYDVSKALLDAVTKWAKSKGMEYLQGPMGFTDFDPEGMLVEGFDKPGTLVGLYNFPYYPEHLEKYGFIKEIDWKEYYITIPEAVPGKFLQAANIARERYKLSYAKPKDLKDLSQRYGYKLFDLINVCYKDLYQYSELNKKQINFYIKLYLSFLRLDTICLIVDENDQLISFGITIPNLTKALQKAKGRLFPFGWFYLLHALRKNDVIDFCLIAVHPDYQNKGVSAMLFADLIPKYNKNGFRHAESNPELETNIKVSSQWKSFEHYSHKRRRVFIKKLSSD
ncbi:MAG: GNAT family N-acetyltransferase [Bacteroidales bacterium]|jgi:GNAT superfamily N-acetyltransferase|nr:GNAT family N-acetyltransferase [Bacteroidales bacterium]